MSYATALQESQKSAYRRAVIGENSGGKEIDMPVFLQVEGVQDEPRDRNTRICGVTNDSFSVRSTVWDEDANLKKWNNTKILSSAVRKLNTSLHSQLTMAGGEEKIYTERSKTETMKIFVKHTKPDIYDYLSQMQQDTSKAKLFYNSSPSSFSTSMNKLLIHSIYQDYNLAKDKGTIYNDAPPSYVDIKKVDSNRVGDPIHLDITLNAPPSLLVMYELNKRSNWLPIMQFKGKKYSMKNFFNVPAKNADFTALMKNYAKDPWLLMQHIRIRNSISTVQKSAAPYWTRDQIEQTRTYNDITGTDSDEGIPIFLHINSCWFLPNSSKFKPEYFIPSDVTDKYYFDKTSYECVMLAQPNTIHGQFKIMEAGEKIDVSSTVELNLHNIGGSKFADGENRERTVENETIVIRDKTVSTSDEGKISRVALEVQDGKLVKVRMYAIISRNEEECGIKLPEINEIPLHIRVKTSDRENGKDAIVSIPFLAEDGSGEQILVTDFDILTKVNINDNGSIARSGLRTVSGVTPFAYFSQEHCLAAIRYIEEYQQENLTSSIYTHYDTDLSWMYGEKSLLLQLDYGNPALVISDNVEPDENDQILLFSKCEYSSNSWLSNMIYVNSVPYGSNINLWDKTDVQSIEHWVGDTELKIKDDATGNPSFNVLSFGMVTQAKKLDSKLNSYSLTFQNGSSAAADYLKPSGIKHTIFTKSNNLSMAFAGKSQLILHVDCKPSTFTLFKDPDHEKVEIPIAFMNAVQDVVIAKNDLHANTRVRHNINPDTGLDYQVASSAVWNPQNPRTGSWHTSDVIRLYDDESNLLIGYARNSYNPFVVDFFDYEFARHKQGGWKEIPEWMLTTLVDNMTGKRLTHADFLTSDMKSIVEYMTFGFRKGNNTSGVAGQHSVGDFSNLQLEQFYQTWKYRSENIEKEEVADSPYKFENATFTNASKVRDACMICVRNMSEKGSSQGTLDSDDVLYSNITPMLFFSNPADFTNPKKMVPKAYMEQTQSFFSYSDKTPFNKLVFCGRIDKNVLVMGVSKQVTKWLEPAQGYQWIHKKDSPIFGDRAFIDEKDNLVIDWTKAGCKINDDNDVEFKDPYDPSGKPVRFKNYKASDKSTLFKDIMENPACNTLFLRSETDSIVHVGQLRCDHPTIKPKVFKKTDGRDFYTAPQNMHQLGHYRFEDIRDALIYKQDGLNFVFYRNTIPGAFTPRRVLKSFEDDRRVVTRENMNVCIDMKYLQSRSTDLAEPARFIQMKKVSDQSNFLCNPTFVPVTLELSETTPIKVYDGTWKYFLNNIPNTKYIQKQQAAFRSGEPRNLDLTKLPRASKTVPGYISVNYMRPAFTLRDKANKKRVEILQDKTIRGYKPTDNWNWTHPNRGTFNITNLYKLNDIYCTTTPDGEGKEKANFMYVCTYQNTGFADGDPAKLKDFSATPEDAPPGDFWNDRTDIVGLKNLGVFEQRNFKKNYPVCQDSFSFGNMLLQMIALGATKVPPIGSRGGFPCRKAVPCITPGAATIEVADGNQYLFGDGTLVSVSVNGEVHGTASCNFNKREWYFWDNLFNLLDDKMAFKAGRYLRVQDQFFRITEVIDEKNLLVEFKRDIHYEATNVDQSEWGVCINAPTRQDYEKRFLPTINEITKVEYLYEQEFTNVRPFFSLASLKDEGGDEIPFWLEDQSKTGKYVILYIDVSKPAITEYKKKNPATGKETLQATHWGEIFDFDNHDITGTIIQIHVTGEKYADFVCTGSDELLKNSNVEENVKKLLTNDYQDSVGNRPFLCVKPPHGIKHINILKEFSDTKPLSIKIVRNTILEMDQKMVGTGKEFPSYAEMLETQDDKNKNLHHHISSNKNEEDIKNISEFQNSFGTVKITLSENLNADCQKNMVYRILNDCRYELVEMEGGQATVCNRMIKSDTFGTNPKWKIDKTFEENPPPNPYFSELYVKAGKNTDLRKNQLTFDMLRPKAFVSAQKTGVARSVNNTALLTELAAYRGIKPNTNYIQVSRVESYDGSVRVGLPKWIGPDEPIPWLSTNVVVFEDKVYTNARPLDAYDRVNAAVFETMSGNVPDFHRDEEYGLTRNQNQNIIKTISKKPTSYQYSLVLPASMVTNMLLVAPTGTGKSIMMYLIGKMYHDYRVLSGNNTMLTFIVKDSTIDQMTGEIFEQQSWADIAQERLHKMIYIHHTDTKEECEDVDTFMDKWEFYSKENLVAKRQRFAVPDKSNRGHSIQPYCKIPPKNDVEGERSDIQQHTVLHIVSMSELHDLYRRKTKFGEAQMYARYIPDSVDHREMSLKDMKQNTTDAELTVLEKVPDILQKMIIEGYFCIDEVHELSESQNQWIRDMLDVRRSELRRHPDDIQGRFVGFTATTASNKKEMISMLQLAAVQGRALPLINTISMDDEGKDFMGASFVDKKKNHFKRESLRRIDVRPSSVKLKAYIRGVTQVHAYDMYAHFEIQPYKFVKGHQEAADDCDKLLGKIGYKGSFGPDIEYDNPEFEYTARVNPPTIGKHYPHIRIEDLEEAFRDVNNNVKKKYTREERFGLLERVEGHDYPLPTIVAHDRGKGYLEDARLYKGNYSTKINNYEIDDMHNGAYVSPQDRLYDMTDKSGKETFFSRHHGSANKMTVHDIFKLLRDKNLPFYDENDQPFIIRCADDPDEAKMAYAYGNYIDKISCQLVKNPDYVYNHNGVRDHEVRVNASGLTEPMTRKFKHAVKTSYQSPPFFQSQLYVLVKIQTKNQATDQYELKDVFVFKKSLKTPMVSIPRNTGWQPGSFFTQSDVIHRRYVKVTLKFSKNPTGGAFDPYSPGSVNVESIIIERQKDKRDAEGLTKHTLRFPVLDNDKKHNPGRSLLKLNADGTTDGHLDPEHYFYTITGTIDFLNLNADCQVDVSGMKYTFGGHIISVEDAVKGRVILLDEQYDSNGKLILISNFEDSPENGAIPNPFQTNDGKMKDHTLFKSDDTPPYYHSPKTHPEEERIMRFQLDEPYFRNKRDVKMKLKKVSFNGTIYNYDDENDMQKWAKPGMAIKRADITVAHHHDFVLVDDLGKPKKKNELGQNTDDPDPDQTAARMIFDETVNSSYHQPTQPKLPKRLFMTLYLHNQELYYSEQEIGDLKNSFPTAFEDKDYSNRTIIRIVSMNKNGSPPAKDDDDIFVYNCIGGDFMNVSMKDTTQIELERIISGRLRSLTATNDDLLKQLVAMKYEGCNDFVDKDSFEEWDPSYFPNIMDNERSFERTQKLIAFTESFRSLTCVSYFSMTLMDNDQYATLTYANNAENQIVKRQYGECEQTTKIILMMLKPALAHEVHELQFGASKSTRLTPAAIARQLMLQLQPKAEGKLGQRDAFLEARKDFDIFQKLTKSLFTEISTILKYPNEPLKSSIFVKDVAHGIYLKNYIVGSQDVECTDQDNYIPDKRRYFTYEDILNVSRIWIDEDGTLSKNRKSNIVNVVWPYKKWYESNDFTNKAKMKKIVAKTITDKSEFELLEKCYDYKFTTIEDQTIVEISKDQKRILLTSNNENEWVSIANPFNPEFATETFTTGKFLPPYFGFSPPWKSYPEIGPYNLRHIHEPIYIGVSKEQDDDDTVLLKTHVSSVMKVISEMPKQLVFVIKKIVPKEAVEFYLESRNESENEDMGIQTLGIEDENKKLFYETESLTVEIVIQIESAAGSLINVTVKKGGLFPMGFLKWYSRGNDQTTGKIIAAQQKFSLGDKAQIARSGIGIQWSWYTSKDADDVFAKEYVFTNGLEDQDLVNEMQRKGTTCAVEVKYSTNDLRTDYEQKAESFVHMSACLAYSYQYSNDGTMQPVGRNENKMPKKRSLLSSNEVHASPAFLHGTEERITLSFDRPNTGGKSDSDVFTGKVHTKFLRSNASTECPELEEYRQQRKSLMILAVQEQDEGLVFCVDFSNFNQIENVGEITVFKNFKCEMGTAQPALIRFNAKDQYWGNKNGLLIADTKTMKSSLDFRGVRVMIKFGFMTYLDAKQVDGRARRLGSHSMLDKEDRNVTQYLIIPYSGYDTPTCEQKYHALVCRQTGFFQTLNDIMMQISLSKTAVDAYGHEDKVDTRVKALQQMDEI